MVLRRSMRSRTASARRSVASDDTTNTLLDESRAIGFRKDVILGEEPTEFRPPEKPRLRCYVETDRRAIPAERVTESRRDVHLVFVVEPLEASGKGHMVGQRATPDHGETVPGGSIAVVRGLERTEVELAEQGGAGIGRPLRADAVEDALAAFGLTVEEVVVRERERGRRGIVQAEAQRPCRCWSPRCSAIRSRGRRCAVSFGVTAQMARTPLE